MCQLQHAVPLEVRVNWQTSHKKIYWRVLRTTLSWHRPGMDALWKILTRCMAFEDWSRCDFSALHYDVYAELPQKGLWAQFAGVSSYKIDTSINQEQMRKYCLLQQDHIIKEPFARSNGVPLTLLIVLYSRDGEIWVSRLGLYKWLL